MSDDLGAYLDKWSAQIASGVKLPVSAQAKITGAGAEAYSKILHDYTPRSDEDYHHGRSAGHANAKHGNRHRKTKHLQDTITYKPGYTADGYRIGSSTDVGWDGHYYDFLAKILNNGSQRAKDSIKFLQDEKFMDRAQAAARDAVEEAELKAYKEALNSDSSE